MFKERAWRSGACLSNPTEHVGGELLDGIKVFGFDPVFANQVGTDAQHGRTRLDPFPDAVWRCFHAAGDHGFDPGHRAENGFDERWPADGVARENLDDFHSEPQGFGNFRRAAAARGVGHAPEVAQLRGVCAERGTHDELSAVVQVNRRGVGVDDGAGAQKHVGQFQRAEVGQFGEHLRSAWRSVGPMYIPGRFRTGSSPSST